MPESARVAARARAGRSEKARAASGPPRAQPPLGQFQALVLQRQRTVGNQAVQRLIRQGALSRPAANAQPMRRRSAASANDSVRPPPRAPSSAAPALERTGVPPIAPPAAPLASLAPIARPTPAGAMRVQRHWYNVSIPFTNYEFDPSIEGVKTAAGVVKDAAVDAFDWIVDKIKSIVASGIDWLRAKWESLQEFATSAFEALKSSFGNILGFLKNPLGFLADAVMGFDAQSLEAGWNRFSSFIAALGAGFKATADNLIGGISRVWSGISSFASSVLDRVAGLTENFVFKRLPDALQSVAYGVIDKLKSLWKAIDDGWNRLFGTIKAWVDDAIEKVTGFVRKVLAFAIKGVIAGIIEFGQMVLLVKDLFSNPGKYVELLATKSVQAFSGVESRFAGIVGQYFGDAKAAAPASGAGATTIHRAPAPGAVEAKTSASWGEIGHGIAATMGKKWDEFKANPMAVVKQLLVDMIFPLAGNIKDIIQLFQDIKKVITGPLGAGSLEEFWTSLLLILDIPIMIYRTIVSILMRSLMVPLIVASFIPHPLVKGIAALVGYGLLGAFVQGETASLAQKLLLLKTGATNQAQKQDAYNSIADSLIALAMTAVIMIIMLILHFIANLMKGVFNFVKGKVFPVETAPVEGKGVAPADTEPAPKDAKAADPGKGPKEGLPSEDKQRRIRMNEEGRCEICASPCEEIRKKYRVVMTPEIEAKIKLIEENKALTELQQEEALKPIDQELADLFKAAPASQVITLDSPARIEATPPQQVGNEVKWKLFDSQSGAEFSDVDVDVSDPKNPGAPDQYLQPKNARLPNGEKAKLEAKFPFTDESLKKNQSVWEKYFNKELTHYSGSIGDENLGNFQAAYDDIRAKNPGMSPQEIGDQAIREVSFGKGRTRVGFGDLSVNMEGFQDVTIEMGPNKGRVVKNVPTTVSVWAGKTKP